MDSFEFEYKLQTVLLVLEALVYFGLAGWCLARSREGRWTTAVAGGAALVGAVVGISGAAAVESAFFDSTEIYEKVFFHQHVSTVLAVARIAGALLLVTGFVLSRRTPRPSTGSIYGPS